MPLFSVVVNGADRSVVVGVVANSEEEASERARKYAASQFDTHGEVIVTRAKDEIFAFIVVDPEDGDDLIDQD